MISRSLSRCEENIAARTKCPFSTSCLRLNQTAGHGADFQVGGGWVVGVGMTKSPDADFQNARFPPDVVSNVFVATR